MALSHKLVTLSYGRALIWWWGEIHLFPVHPYTGEGMFFGISLKGKCPSHATLGEPRVLSSVP